MAQTKQQKTEEEKKVVKRKKKKTLNSPKVRVVVNASYNNTLVAVTDLSGKVLVNSSCGAIGFAGSRKSTTYASTKAGEDAASKAAGMGAREAEVVVKGIGIGRQAAVKGIKQGGLRITSLADQTAIPHGGVKPRRRPRK